MVVVTAKRSQQLTRCARRSFLKSKEVNKRIKSQISQNAKARFADFIIDNSGTLGKTRKQVSEIRRVLVSLAHKGFSR